MTILRADTLATGSVLDAPICVIGSGAAGITLARSLAASGRSVTVLEAGALEREPAQEAADFAADLTGYPQRNPEPARGRAFGGSTNLWFGRIARPDPIDFRSRSWVPHSGWPIGLDELDPWLAVAAEILQVPQFDKTDLSAWPSHPTIETFAHQSLTDLRPFMWSSAMRMGDQHRAEFARSDRITVVTDCTVTGLVTSDSGRNVEEIRVHSGGAGRLTVRCRLVVLATGGLENARLLLATAREGHPGIGNEHGSVGRFYMDHPRGEGLARLSFANLTPLQRERFQLLGERSRSVYGRVQLRVVFPDLAQERFGLLNHAMHAHLVSSQHSQPAFNAIKTIRRNIKSGSTEDRRETARLVGSVLKGSPGLARLGVRRLTGRSQVDGVVFVDQMEQEPDRNSRVTVDHSRLDRFGLPRLQLDWRIGDSTFRSQRWMHQTMQTALRHVGIDGFDSDVLRSDVRPDLWDMKHPSGTTRMSDSALHGVVDRNCRVHSVENLFVAGSSVFPTVGHANPTLLIVALAARLADHLTKMES